MKQFDRKWIYYAYTLLMGAGCIGLFLNNQFTIRSGNGGWDAEFPWELTLAAFGSCVYVLGCVFLAALSDRFGRLKCIALALFVIGVSSAAFGLIPPERLRLWHYFAYWAPFNVGMAVFFTSVEGLISDYQDHRLSLARRMGRYCMAWSAGNVLAGFSVGWANANGLARGVCLVFAGLTFVACLATIADLKMNGDKKLADTGIGNADLRPEAPFFAVLGRTGLFFACLALMGMLAVFPRYGKDWHGLSEDAIGNLVGISMFAQTVTYFAMGRLTFWHYSRCWQVALSLAFAAGLALMIAAPVGSVAALAAAFVLCGVGYGVMYFFSIYYSLMVTEGHAKSGGIHEAFLGVGNLIGPLAGLGAMRVAVGSAGVAPERSGVMSLWMALCGVAIALIVITVVIRRRG